MNILPAHGVPDNSEEAVETLASGHETRREVEPVDLSLLP